MKNVKALYLFIFIQCLMTCLYAEIEELIPEVISVLPHDPQAFTQGLAIKGDVLYESTGLYGYSTVRQINLKNGRLVREYSLPPFDFGEGLAIIGNQLVQLTWREQRAWIYDRTTLRLLGFHRYEGEGWGLCDDGQYFIMTNGSDTITMRDPATFAIVLSLRVKWGQQNFAKLNDIACVDNHLYVNVLGKDYILRLNKANGFVTGVIDASGLLSPEEKALLSKEEDVLNGIAYHPERQTFFLTGKRWPWIFEVRFKKK